MTWHGASKNFFFDILGILQKSGRNHEKDCTVSIVPVNTPFQRLRRTNIPYENIISEWSKDWYDILYSGHQ